MLMESRVLSLLSKFAGLLYFHPYSNASTSVLLECEPHRKCPIDLTKVLLGESDQLGENTQKSFFHFIINLAWITEFIRQSKFKSVINGTFDQSSAHIREFEKLGSIAHGLLQNLGTVNITQNFKLQSDLRHVRCFDFLIAISYYKSNERCT